MTPASTRSRPKELSRPGATVVEAAIILLVATNGLLVLLDLGMAVAQSNSLADCARHAARLAVVRGAGSSEPLGPLSWTGTLDEPHPLAEAVRARLLAMPADRVTLSATWPEGNNQQGSRVNVSLQFEHRPLLMDLLGQIELTAQSTMRILR